MLIIVDKKEAYFSELPKEILELLDNSWSKT